MQGTTTHPEARQAGRAQEAPPAARTDRGRNTGKDLFWCNAVRNWLGCRKTGFPGDHVLDTSRPRTARGTSALL